MKTGLLFTDDYLTESITQEAEYRDIDVDYVYQQVQLVFEKFPTSSSPSEAKTEDDLIWKVLSILGWQHFDRQVPLSESGRENIPDGLMYLDEDTKLKANESSSDWEYYNFGVALIESKRWMRKLDRGMARKTERTAPASQVLRYLRRVDDLTNGKVRWGILTNGAVWRLYFQGSRSVSEQYFEFDLYSLFCESPTSEAVNQEYREHWLRVFILMFRREAFEKISATHDTFHSKALAEGKYYEERVTKELSEVVFQTVFPSLAGAIAKNWPKADLQDVQYSVMILLYRLLFIFYAEDRGLLPVQDDRYKRYALRFKVRDDIGKRLNLNETFSSVQGSYWSAIEDLSLAIDAGDSSIGLPPYNGGLFDQEATPLLNGIRIPDNIISKAIELLSFETDKGVRRYINYRNLSVFHLGSIYERLLEFELRYDKDKNVIVHPNSYARKTTGSYYTPESLVMLIIKETLEPLIEEKVNKFKSKVIELSKEKADFDKVISVLLRFDPAENLLNLRVCDPAMGSGHFLVNLVDYLAEVIVELISEVTNIVDWTDEPYVSPLVGRISKIRMKIEDNATDNTWNVDSEQLDDWNIVRRIILKKCVYGVDKNPMAVELAKVSLWLHTFTSGAPLSFLDHHLRCGDSIFGENLGRVLKRLNEGGREFLIRNELNSANKAAESMQTIEGITDIEISEAHRSSSTYSNVTSWTNPVNAFLRLIHALDWLQPFDPERQSAVQVWLDGQIGDPMRYFLDKWKISTRALEVISMEMRSKDRNGNVPNPMPEGVPECFKKEADIFDQILDEAKATIKRERFLNWEIEFPGVWDNWLGDKSGGFDAIIGNPPWDVYEFQELPWFAYRKPDIALIPSKSERVNAIKGLKKSNKTLWEESNREKERIGKGVSLIKSKNSPYKYNNKGKLDLYKLFAERSLQLLSPNGVMGLLVKTGIATEKSTAEFFHNLAVTQSVKAIYSFTNKKVFFPDIHSSEKPCVFIASNQRRFESVNCAFGLQSVDELENNDRLLQLSSDDFKLLNPQTKTAPVFENTRDADIIISVYRRNPLLYEQSTDKLRWPVTFHQMLNRSTDESKFKTVDQLERDEGAFRISNNQYQSSQDQWIPVYEGKMVQAYDHRAADIVVNTKNVFRAGQQVSLTQSEKINSNRFPKAQFYIRKTESQWPTSDKWIIAYKNVTSTTNMRTMIASIIPESGAVHSLPVLSLDSDVDNRAEKAALILATLNSIAFDYVSRQKVPGINFSWYLLKQLPVVPFDHIEITKFGSVFARDLIKDTLLELTYTASDLAPFALDMGYVEEGGTVKEPFSWNEDRRLRLIAKLDAIFFILYGLFDSEERHKSRENITYIYSTFPIIEREETKRFGRYLSRDMTLAYCNSLTSGNPLIDPEV